MARNCNTGHCSSSWFIIGKSDNNFDLNCQFCTTCVWNAVYVMHADGSVAWYGHMKAGSLTPKNIGESVAVGEYLGLVGSSGYSTGPHLHFEVQADNSATLPPNLIDPWAGNCNTLNDNTSWWADQQPYRVPTLNKIMLHGINPTIAQCASAESVNERLNFSDGSSFYVGSYYRDQTTIDSSIHTIYKPDNTVWQTWKSNPPNSENMVLDWNWVLPSCTCG
jgi:murein DD-endopeptidase MepM/ murein hydrolase activator NlpD